MELYVGMDVSLKETSICVVDSDGEVRCEGTVLSEPEVIAEFVKSKGAARGAYRSRNGADHDLAVARATGAWLARDLHRCPSCQGGIVDANQQERPQ